MSTEHSMYVGAYIKLDEEYNRDPIVLGPGAYWGCPTCADTHEEEAKRREGTKYCEVCGTPNKHITSVRRMDDCIHNVIYEELKNHPLYKAVTNIGEYVSLDGICRAILVDDPDCSIDVPSINFEDDCTKVTRLTHTLSPEDAIVKIALQHGPAISVLNEYFNKVTVVYGGVYICS